jgi:glutathione reductase (NADPH)
VTDRINLTPVALMEGMALAATIVKGTPTKPDYEAVPSAVFSWPSIATVVRFCVCWKEPRCVSPL